MNTAVRDVENYHKLKEMQKKLDKRAIDASADPSLMEIKVSVGSGVSAEGQVCVRGDFSVLENFIHV